MEPSINQVWVLLSAFLVMLMQVGFALVETGSTRAKNAVNTIGMNLVIYPVGVLGFWLVGYALMLGASASGLHWAPPSRVPTRCDLDRSGSSAPPGSRW